MVATATIKRLQTWVWVLVYAGIVLVGVGLTARRSDASTGSTVAWIGALLIAAGVLLIWIRSRIRPDPTPPKRPAP
jgi:uncharacterized membrane protein HdeD (DUF308 family)